MNAEVLSRVRRRLVDTGHVPATARAGGDGARGLGRPDRPRPAARPGAGGRVGAVRCGAAGAAAAGRRDHRRPGQCAGQCLGGPGLRTPAGTAPVSRRGGGPRSRPAAGRPRRPAAGRCISMGRRRPSGRDAPACGACRPSRSAAPACRCALSVRAASRWPSWIGPARFHAGPPVWSIRSIRARAAFLVSGGTGTGKTTLLGAMLGLVEPGERLVLVEDADGAAHRSPARGPARGADRRTSRVRARCRCATWSAKPCGCGRTGSWWARSAVPKWWSC